MKKTTYLKMFETRDSALSWMRMKNQACRAAGNGSDLYVVTDGPADNFAVMDLATAIELSAGYTWEV